MSDNKKINENLCLAPWVHTYLSPQSERRMCCASREEPQNFKQYIDSGEADNQYNPLTLEEHWNSDHMKDVRRRMLAGEKLPECEVCDKKLLNTSVYRDYFNNLFKDQMEDALTNTSPEGYYAKLPISFDYRLSNHCNFKCRMCGSMLSSSIEAEERKFNGWTATSRPWMVKEVRTSIEDFQTNIAAQEFLQAVEEKRVREIYWVGGEPLLWPHHWEVMQKIIDSGEAKNVVVRYNTNLSNIKYRNINLFNDILVHFKTWDVCASIDGTGKIGEYIRSGLNYSLFHDNFKIGAANRKTQAQRIRLDLTITLPGLFELKNMFDLSKEMDSELLTKVCFTFNGEQLMCPLALPQDILHPILDDVLDYVQNNNGYDPRLHSSFVTTITHLRTRETYDTLYPDFEKEIKKGKKYLLEYEHRRKDKYTMEDILKENNQEAYKWYNNI